MGKFNLSEKINKFVGWHSKENRFIHINHIKEFIKKLKEELSYGCVHCLDGKKRIDELAGKDLIDVIVEKGEEDD